MPNYRRGRVNDEMKKELAMILRDIKDPRVSDNFVSVTAVDVTPDLKYAKIYFSAITGDKKEIMKGLKSASGFIRKRIAEGLNLRITPELSFEPDDSIEYGAKINSLLRKIDTDKPLKSEDADENA